ncbi:hypothetical protein H0O01_04620 [Candidatus Micrarchaeota archaeon]|nr:hypothetical protein [Candidatus Micrarchaeota archaeon]
MPQPVQKSKEGVEWPERIPMSDMQRMDGRTSGQLIDLLMQPPYVERYGNLTRDDQAVMEAIGELNRRIQNGSLVLSDEQKQNLRMALLNMNIGGMSVEEARSVTDLRDAYNSIGTRVPTAEEMPQGRQNYLVFTEQAIKTIESPPYLERSDGLMVVDTDAVLRAISSLHKAMEDGTLRLSGDQASRLWWAIANMRVSSMPSDEVPMAIELRDYASSQNLRMPPGGMVFGQE